MVAKITRKGFLFKSEYKKYYYNYAIWYEFYANYSNTLYNIQVKIVINMHRCRQHACTCMRASMHACVLIALEKMSLLFVGMELQKNNFSCLRFIVAVVITFSKTWIWHDMLYICALRQWAIMGWKWYLCWEKYVSRLLSS